MYKTMKFDEFFCDKNQEDILPSERKIAISLITPNQIVHVAPTDKSIEVHLELSLSIICDIYKIEKPFRGYDKIYICNLMAEIAKHMKGDERNFVLVRYILLRNIRIAILEYPYYITEYEFQQVKQLDILYKQYEIEARALIQRYDPIDSQSLTGSAITFEKEKDDDAVKKSLDYIQEHGLISNYELNAPKEYILK